MTQTQQEKPLSRIVADLLPYLRRYARALTGSQAQGDKYAATTLEAFLTDRSIFETASSNKVALFASFHKIWQSSGAQVKAAETGLGAQAQEHLAGLTNNTREALLRQLRRQPDLQIALQAGFKNNLRNKLSKANERTLAETRN